MKSILDPSFRYVSSGSTDLHKTFARIRREQKNSEAVATYERSLHVVAFPRDKQVNRQR